MTLVAALVFDESQDTAIHLIMPSFHRGMFGFDSGSA